MASSEERMKILKMIADGKITAEEGAKLLAALSESAKSNKAKNIPRSNLGDARWLRVRVTDIATGKTKATVNLPIGLVDVGLNIAARYAPDVAFDELLTAIQSGAQGKLIDVYDETDGEHVEIYIE
ncbi:MAG: SHOCT-like domain-containing protein [Anaerolineales bacterium]